MKAFLLSTVFALAALLGGPSAQAENLASGKLEAAFSSWGSKSLAGSWAIERDGEDHYLVLGDDFKAKKGPDVRIFLSPANRDSIDGNNASENAVFVKLLDDFKGAARIKLPVGVDISDYKSLVFHCEKYAELWGTSPLQ